MIWNYSIDQKNSEPSFFREQMSLRKDPFKFSFQSVEGRTSKYNQRYLANGSQSKAGILILHCQLLPHWCMFDDVTLHVIVTKCSLPYDLNLGVSVCPPRFNLNYQMQRNIWGIYLTKPCKMSFVSLVMIPRSAVQTTLCVSLLSLMKHRLFCCLHTDVPDVHGLRLL